MVFQGCVKEFFKKFKLSRVFQQVSRVFHKSLKHNLRMIEGYLQGVFNGFHGYLNTFKGNFTDIPKKFQGYSKKVFRVLQGRLKGISMKF